MTPPLPRTILTTVTRIGTRPQNLNYIASVHPLYYSQSMSSTFTSSSPHTTSALTLKSTIPLSSGHQIPILGYGVYQTPAKIAESVVLHALRIGYRHVDSARVYRNEVPCAEAVRACGLRRDEVFFTSKVGPKEMRYEMAKKAIDSTLQTTQLTYIDLMLLHAPAGGTTARNGAWRALVEAQKEGKIRSIGVSNYSVRHLDELESYISSSGVGGKIDVGQWEIHPWLPRDDIVTWAKERQIVIQAWSPLVRAQRPDDPTLAKLGAKHNKTWAQILIRWSLQKGYVPLPKSVTLERIESNADVFDFELDNEDMKALEFPGSYEPCSWDPTVWD